MTARMYPMRRNTIVLNGGPQDGNSIVITDSTASFGRLKVPLSRPVVFEENPDIIVPVRIGIYERKGFMDGTPGTCEFRTWTEWHWAGEV